MTEGRFCRQDALEEDVVKERTGMRPVICRIDTIVAEYVAKGGCSEIVAIGLWEDGDGGFTSL